mmetsp:Transcript_10482/g.23148  ORF Transcript_10482/g.23148 Transcript_10482/m.23148 type:complete len:257 (-) Transcript_10482:551-1321(-)
MQLPYYPPFAAGAIIVTLLSHVVPSCRALQPPFLRSLRRVRVDPFWASPPHRTWTPPPSTSPSDPTSPSWYSVIESFWPPAELDSRNAISRTDGYWPYIYDGKDPPPDHTYGEFDATFFAYLVGPDCGVRIWKAQSLDREHDPIFVDLGSGTGRLVCYAAGLRQLDGRDSLFRECRGIEYLPGLHVAAEKAAGTLPLDGQTPVSFFNAAFADIYVADRALVDADIIFSFSSCMTPEVKNSLFQWMFYFIFGWFAFY